MAPKTPKEFFEKTLPSRFKPEKSVGIAVVVQLNITGPEGGSWAVTIKEQKLYVVEGIDSAPTLTLKMNETDFIDMVNGRLSPEKAFFTGRVQFKGDLGVALKLRDAGFL
jgi:putative sterol carrier protein